MKLDSDGRLHTRRDPAGDEMLKCKKCGRVTTRKEASKRPVRTGRCGHCGGSLKRDEYRPPHQGIR